MTKTEFQLSYHNAFVIMLKNENYKIEFLIIKIIISDIDDKHNAFAYRYVFSIFPARELHVSLADTFLIPFPMQD